MAPTRKVSIQPSQACPLCREGLAGAESLGVCPGCDTLYHHACARELGGCATIGCPDRQAKRQQRPNPRPATEPREWEPRDLSDPELVPQPHSTTEGALVAFATVFCLLGLFGLMPIYGGLTIASLILAEVWLDRARLERRRRRLRRAQATRARRLENLPLDLEDLCR